MCYGKRVALTKSKSHENGKYRVVTVFESTKITCSMEYDFLSIFANIFKSDSNFIINKGTSYPKGKKGFNNYFSYIFCINLNCIETYLLNLFLI